MALETGTYISDLVATNPTASDAKSQGDDHLRLVKSTVKATFPNVAGAVTPTHLELNYVAGVTSALQTQLNLKAPKDAATFTGNTTLPGTTVIGSVVSQEIAYLSGVTSAIQTQINAKAPTASPTFTGTVTLPATINSTDAVRKDYADALAFSAVLPAQTGNAGKFVTTNGTIASWAYAGIANVTTATGMTTLTNSPTLLQITPTAYGIAVTLPDATTCPLGGPLHKIYNAGAYPVRLLNSTGTLIGFVFAGVTSDVSLVNNSTASGVWDVSNVELVGASAQLLTTNMFGVYACIDLGSGKEFLLGLGASQVNMYGVVYDKTTNTFGSVTLIRAASFSGTVTYAACLSAANQVLVTSVVPANTNFEAVTLSISGTTITVNTAATATLSANISAFADGCGLIAVGSSFVTSYTVATPAAQIRALSISGTTVTIGAASVLSGTIGGLIQALGSVVVAHSTLVSTATYFQPFTVGGSTLTLGTSASTAVDFSGGMGKFLNPGSGRLIAIYPAYGAVMQGTVVTLTGTTVTISSTTLFASWSAIADAIVISSTKVLVLHTQGSSNANILTDTAGTASAGSAITLSSQAARACVYVSGTDVCVAEGSLAGANAVAMISCSGASPVRNTYAQLAGESSCAPYSASDAVLRISPNQVVSGAFAKRLRTASIAANNFQDWQIRGGLSSALNVSSAYGVANAYRGKANSERWLADGSTVITKLECAQ